jgi:hypothetical protein
MKRQEKRLTTIIFLYLFGFLSFGCQTSSDKETLYYAVEMDGRTFGFQEVEVMRVEDAGRPLLSITENVRSMMRALGMDIDTRSRSEYRLDPETYDLVSCESVIDQGPLKVRIAASSEGSTVKITVEPGGGTKNVSLADDVIFENPFVLPHLKRDFSNPGVETRTYRVLDLLDRKVQDVTYTKRETEAVETPDGKVIDALVLDSFNHDIGLKLRLWIDPVSGRMIRADGPRSRSRRADKNVGGKLERADLSRHILASAGTHIEDITSVSRIRLKAVLEPVGSRITAESLNVPGQMFQGSVEENRIEGTFDISYGRYDGLNAPGFPPPVAGRPELKPYLEPEDFIESDDQVLHGKALEITAGAGDSWDAAKRLSRWVADNIGYDIPGGASARNTYDLREGECGAHSRLFTAFCRSVGIPSRVVWGCIYLPDRSGSFGQHAWNEVFMGDAGWIPIDTTARQIDFVDSGHVRLSVLSSAHIAWNPKAMEILDYQMTEQSGEKGATSENTPALDPYAGLFRGPRGEIKVFVKDGGLSLELADGRTFGLRNPGLEGKWYFQATRDVDVVFDKDGSGRITGLVLTNRVRLPKRDDRSETGDDIPADLRPYIGHYPFPMSKAEIVIRYQDGRLAMDFPGSRVQRLEGPDENGFWRGSGPDLYSFIRENGEIRAMIFHEIVRSPRIR